MSTNQLNNEPKEIENKFTNYYRDFYSQPPPVDRDQIKAFLDKLDLPAIGEMRIIF